jgi:hypothetical protein
MKNTEWTYTIFVQETNGSITPIVEKRTDMPKPDLAYTSCLIQRSDFDFIRKLK